MSSAGVNNAKTYDAVVIGGGHNGLVAAALLAGKGKSVCVLEQSASLGGMAQTADLMPGARGPDLAHLLYNFSPVVARKLGLGGFLKTSTMALPTIALAADGRHLAVDGASVQYADGTPHPDAAAYAALHNRLVRFAALLARMATKAPPRLNGGLLDMATLRELAGLGRIGLGLKRMGKAEMREFLRILLSNIYDVVLDELPDGPLAGLMAADAVRGAHAGPRSPGSVFSLLYRLGNGGAVTSVTGGIGALSTAIADMARSRGCDLRTACAVARIIVEQDAVQAVELASGEIIKCRAILSSAGPLQTLTMAGVAAFDVETTRQMRNLRAKGSTAKLNLVLKSTPKFTGLSAAQQAARLVYAPSATYVEQAFNPAKYGEIGRAPVLEMLMPGLSDPSLVSDGRQVLSVIIGDVPVQTDDNWGPASRDALMGAVMGVLERLAPGLGALVMQQQLHTPADIERMTGAPGGHWHHIEMGLDQVLTLRPANGAAHYRFGVAGLYLCGASTHPGGDLTGAPGHNAALQLLKDGVV